VLLSKRTELTAPHSLIFEIRLFFPDGTRNSPSLKDIHIDYHLVTHRTCNWISAPQINIYV